MMNETPERTTDPEADDTAGGAARVEAAMEAAGLWLARLDSGTGDREAFERWRAADPAHAVAFARVASAWTALAAPAVVTTRPPRRAGLSRRAMVLSLGGAALAAAGAGMSSRVLARERVATGVGERRTIRLAADARADLNTDSRLSWRVREAATEAWLERGESAIAVSPGARPLILHAAGSDWRLGPGRYNVRLDEARLVLIALDGTAHGAAGLRAQTGQQVVVQAGKASLAAAPEAALEKAVAWPQGEIVFVDAPLSEAVAEYNRYLERKIVIVDPAIGRLRIGGRFTSSDPTDFLAALEVVLPVRARRDQQAHLLTAAE